jgi:large subunit ribosomal protein L4
VGGGVAFGPVVRSHAFSLPKKIRKLALLHAINDKIKNNAMFIVDQIEFDRPSIKNILSVKDSFELNSALFVTIDKDNNLMLSCSNLKGFDSIALVGLNVYDIIKHKSLFFTKVAWQQFCGE